MKRLATASLAALALIALLVGPALADGRGPCSDGSGRSYAQHHIVELARAGMLGAGEHTPGGHQGFSLCLGVHS